MEDIDLILDFEKVRETKDANFKIAFFVYPSVDFCSKEDKKQGILSTDVGDISTGGVVDKTLEICEIVDKRNLLVAKKEILRVSRQIVPLKDRGEEFDAKTLMKKYSISNCYYDKVCDLYLKMISMMLYKNLYMFYNLTTKKKEQKAIIEEENKNGGIKEDMVKECGAASTA